MDKINFKKPGMHQPKTSITGSISMYKDVVRKFDSYYNIMQKNLAYKHTNFITNLQMSQSKKLITKLHQLTENSIFRDLKR